MSKQEETRETILKILKRSEGGESKTPYAYEIYATALSELQPLVIRTVGSQSFETDFDEAVNTAKSSGMQLKVILFRGKSQRAAEIGNYVINVSQHVQQMYTNDDLEAIVAERLELSKAKAPTSSLSGLDGLGFLEKLNDSQRNIDRLEAEKNHADFVNGFKYDALKEKHDTLIASKIEIETKYNLLEKEIIGLKAQNAQNEDIIAGSSTNQLLSKVATGFVTNIGAKLISGSPKVATLLGISPQELGSALGTLDMVDQDQQLPASTPMVDISPVEESPRDSKLKTVVEVLKNLDDEEFSELIKIIGYSSEYKPIREKVTNVIAQILIDNKQPKDA